MLLQIHTWSPTSPQSPKGLSSKRKATLSHCGRQILHTSYSTTDRMLTNKLEAASNLTVCFITLPIDASVSRSEFKTLIVILVALTSSREVSNALVSTRLRTVSSPSANGVLAQKPCSSLAISVRGFHSFACFENHVQNGCCLNSTSGSDTGPFPGVIVVHDAWFCMVGRRLESRISPMYSR